MASDGHPSADTTYYHINHPTNQGATIMAKTTVPATTEAPAAANEDEAAPWEDQPEAPEVVTVRGTGAFAFKLDTDIEPPAGGAGGGKPKYDWSVFTEVGMSAFIPNVKPKGLYQSLRNFRDRIQKDDNGNATGIVAPEFRCQPSDDPEGTRVFRIA